MWQSKRRVVEADPTERGERAHLNFGHTFGHAIEKVSRFEIAHGAAVALGMAAATHVAVAVKLLTEPDRQRILRLITAAGLHTRGLLGMDVDRLIDAMKSDKKVEAGLVRLVLPKGIGNATIHGDVSMQLIKSAFEAIS